jgi:DNA-binding transcriptional LysR family regulator
VNDAQLQRSQLKPSQLKISQLRAFVTVADCGSFSAAALQLDLSQSTVSHAIASLEAELGVILLARGRQGAQLTAVGTEILPDVRQVLVLLDKMQQKANRDKGLQSGTVRIASVRSLATHLLPDAMARFHQQFPAINLVIQDCACYPDVEQMLLHNQAEIGLTLLPAAERFETYELIQDEFVALFPDCFCSDLPNHQQNYKQYNSQIDVNRLPSLLSWEQLVQYPMIMNPVAAPHIHTRTIQQHLAQFGYQLNVMYEVKEDSTIVGMVKRGLGATILARLAAEPVPEGIQVFRLPVPLKRSIGAILLKETLLPKAVFVLLDILKQVC